MLYDLHNHTEYSFDSERSMRQTIEESIAAGIDIMGISDHLDFSPGDPGADYYHAERQFAEFPALKDEYSGRIDLHLGIEASYEDYYYDKTKSIISAWPFEYVIMSVHFVEKLVISNWIEKIEKNASSAEDVDYSPYFRQMLDTVRYADFDILGHMDYYKKYSAFSHVNTFERYNDFYTDILKVLIDRGKVLEINTSGLRQACNEQFPSESILSMYKSLGGNAVVTGSDSHKTGQAGYGIDTAENLIQKYDFEKFIPWRNNGC